MAEPPSSSATQSSRRRTTGWRNPRLVGFLLAGLLVTVVLAVLVSPYASSDPDGLEKVAADKGIDRDVEDHAFADSPLADYGVEGVDSAELGTGLAGLIGVAVTFVVGVGLFLVVRRRSGGDHGPGDDLAARGAS